jgi:hypothetical protein
MYFKDKSKGEDGTETETRRICFKVVYVFDITQTDGTPLPELPTRSVGDRGQDMLDRLLRFAESRGIAVRFVDRCSLNGAAGISGVKRSKSVPAMPIFRRRRPHWRMRSHIRCSTGLPTGNESLRAKASRLTSSSENLRLKLRLMSFLNTLPWRLRPSSTSPAIG